MMKKFIASVSLAALMSLAPLSAAAQAPALCPLENCSRMGEHSHDGVCYSGHYAGDGHGHRVCDVSGCTKTGRHQHDGKSCLPHNDADGHGYHHREAHSQSRHGGRHH